MVAHQNAMQGSLHSVIFFKKQLLQTENRGRQFTGDFILDGQRTVSVTGLGNGPLSATLAALHPNIEGTVVIREYAEHSLGEGTEVKAASYVEVVYEAPGARKVSAWGVATDTDITGSGIKAVLTAANNVKVILKI